MGYEEEWVNGLNGGDIESMCILKDGGCGGVYGWGGGNGVVMISSKKGMVDKWKVSVDGGWGVNSGGVGEYDMMKDERE